MIIIEEALISSEVLNKKFCCNLQACKGACCWEGDLGAPLEEEEVSIIQDQIYNRIKHLLDQESQEIIAAKGIAIENNGFDHFSTPLKTNGACVYMTGKRGENARCAFEIAYEHENTDFWKPISCHLYPIRISKTKKQSVEFLNYDEWDICEDALKNGKKLDIDLIVFVKDALIRKYGLDFYHQLEEAMKYKSTENPNNI